MPTAKKQTHLKDIALLFAIPLTIALIAAAVVYVPRLLANPAYDFIYATCGDYYCSPLYTVDQSGRIVSQPQPDSFLHPRASQLRYYDSAKGSFRDISPEEAVKYSLLTDSKSPDGYTLTKETSRSGFLFWSTYDGGWYLVDGAKKKNVTLTAGNTVNRDDIKFLGWVKK